MICCSAEPLNPGSKNLLVILSDQHARLGIGAYGSEVARTPNLDALASAGVRFDNAYCPAPLCVPSRMSFLTSRFPRGTRVWDNTHMLDPNMPTWVHSLGAAGVETALVGRMHFVGCDQMGGFIERPLGEYSSCPPGTQPDHPYLWKRMSVDTAGQTRESVETSGRGRTFYQWFDEQVTAAICKYLEKRTHSKTPFAAVVGYVLPHCPFFAPEDLFNYYHARVNAPAVPSDLPPTIERFRRIRGLVDPPVSEERVRIARAAYFGLCEFLDQQVGRVLRALEDSGLSDETTVVYASDHGEMDGEKGCWWKSNFYEGSAGVPLIVREPGSRRAPARINEVCNLTDLGPTFCEMLGADPPPFSQGRSLLPLLRSTGPHDWDNETFSEFVDTWGESDYFAARMIRSGPWKLWEYVDGVNLPPVLFHLREDRGENNNLWGQPGYEDTGRRLRERLHEGWDPSWARAESKANDMRFRAMEAWGRTVRPTSPHLLIPPHEDLEAGIDTLR